ncbi:piercer of microtubule wall 1 protein [Peromyscus eremicus]|uniref:piercer of microtubule wall 1 protein n=1 Tax=Peromyscus eremicus TaxID=42410 RepID=UPI0027DE97D8|nr:piercer of microtubule wall 1 protein [Peromyscus eremicus]
MSEENPQECTEPLEPKAKSAPEKTSDYYRVSEQLPVRFNNPGWFRGYRTNELVSMYRTSNQTYGSRAPTVHEMPTVFYPSSNKFSRECSASGMFLNNTFNVGLEKSVVTGPDNYITHYDRLNFHPSYNVNRPSICD